MKKITSFMLMLLCAMTAWAQGLVQITTDTSKPIYYTIYNTRSDSPGGLLYYAGDNAGLKDGCNVTTLENKYKFYFTGSDDALYVHNAATTNKLASVGSWTAEGSVWCVIKRNDGNLAFGPKDASQDAKVWWNEQNQGRDGYTEWTANDAGSGFVVELASEFTYPEIGKFYTIEAPLFENVQSVAKGLVANGGNSLGWNTVDLANKNYYWTLVKDDETNTLYLKNVGTGYYINGDAVRENAAALTTNALGSNQFNIITNNVKLHAAGHNEGNGSNGGVVSWDGAANSASAWKFVEREDPDAVKTLDITYNFTYKGQALDGYTQTKTVLVGQEYPNIEIEFPFGITVVKPVGNVAADAATTVTIAVEENLPFVSAADYNSIENWYFMKNKGEFYLSHNTTSNHIALGDNQKNIDLNNRDAFSWAFIGNPFDGFQIVNKAAGEGYILSSSTTLEGNTGAETYPVLTKTPVSEGNNTLWMITSSTYQTNGFYLAQKGFANNRMNNRDNKLAYWNTGADNGSTFTVELRDDALIDVATVEEFKSRVIPALGHVGGYALNTKETIEAIETISEMEEFLSENDVISFDNNKYYRVQNVYRKTYISVNENKERVLKDASNADINQLWQIETTENGKYRIKSPNAGYMQAVGNNALVAENGAELNIVSFVEGAGQFAIKSGNDMLAGINNTTLGTWWNGSIDGDMSYRFLEADDVEITLSNINDEGWATAYLPFDVTLSEGLTAYYVNEINNKGGYVKFAEISDIPANNGVVLTGKPGVYKLNIAVANSEVTGNYLKGTTVTTEITKENGCAYYVMANDTEDGLGFYNAALGEDDTKFKNTANKAYLYISGTTGTALSASLRFDFDGTTGIEEVEIRNEKEEIYDLTGRRVNEITKAGVYIVNGRKVLVK